MAALALERLRCGIIVTAAFRSWLAEWWKGEAAAHAGMIPQLDFVRCAAGDRAGQQWLSLFWRPAARLAEHECYEIGGVQIHISRQTRIGLRDRCLDVRDGRIAVV